MSSVPESVLLDHSGGILLLVDPASLAICDASKPTLTLLGYSRDQLLGRPITDVECSLADTFFWEDVGHGAPADVRNADSSYRCASGEVLTASKTVSRASGNGDNWLVVRAEPRDSGPALAEQIATAASLLRATLEATADGILLVDRSGGIRNLNRRFSRLWDLPDALLFEHTDQLIFDFMAGRFADPHAYRTVLSNIALDGDGETFDLLELADGRCFERKSTPARHGACILGRVFSFTDVTERKRADAARASLEAQLRESQKMQAIGTLAGGIAHDFNNILATILGNTDLAREDLGDNQTAMESLNEIHKAGSRARDLVQQILSFSRRQPTERKPIALCAVIEESVRLLRTTLPARLTLKVHCDADVPPALADTTQVEQIVINLVANAMQAMDGEPGRIDLRLDSVLLDNALASTHPGLGAMYEKHPGRTLRLAVIDNGPGMDAATMERIFEPFFTTKPVNEGTGLGLSVVLGIVQSHEGAITVDSQPGHGATFTLYLPVSANPAPEVTAPAIASARAEGSQHILYLDDDDSLLFLIKRLLERRGYRVSAHSDQRDALDALRANPGGFDLVVTDYNMPGMSGLDVARAVRDIRTDLPVAVASGFIDEALRAQAEGAGVRELIFKASKVEDLCEAFARLARAVGESSRSPTPGA